MISVVTIPVFSIKLYYSKCKCFSLLKCMMKLLAVGPRLVQHIPVLNEPVKHKEI